MSESILPEKVRNEGLLLEARTVLELSVSRCLHMLASLKLTIALFCMAMLVVFVGSLAQSRRDVWQVMSEYFRVYVAWIQVADFFPPSMFPEFIGFDWNSLGPFRHFPFPGGWLIGWVMLANLTTAHLLKFKIRVRGSQLAGGIFFVSLACLVTAGIIIVANQQTGSQSGNFALSPQHIWFTLLGVLSLASAIPLWRSFSNPSQSRSSRIVLRIIGVVIGAVVIYCIARGEDARLNLSAMRILWQLLKGCACALLLLYGCLLLFEKRGAVVTLHCGVALLMFSELMVGIWGHENMMPIREGERSNVLVDNRVRELAIIRQDSEGNDHVVAVAQPTLEIAASHKNPDDQIIPIKALPFDIAVRSYLTNSELRGVLPDDKNTTAAGLGSFAVPVRLDQVTGMDETPDQGSVYVDIIERGSRNVLSSIVLSQSVSEIAAEVVKVAGTEYQFFFRFQRNYRPYEIELKDVSRTLYVGTSEARDFRSTIVIHDPSDGSASEFTLWMNNPLRYRGETFYQHNYNQLNDGREQTVLSVVRNTGWMMPYIACMIVSVGMIAQFWQTLTRYLRRKEAAQFQFAPSDPTIAATTGMLPLGVVQSGGIGEPLKKSGWRNRKGITFEFVVPVVSALVAVVWLAMATRPTRENPKAMNLDTFGRIPFAWKGRAQPVDSFARTQMLRMSHKSTFECELSQRELNEKRDKLVAAVARFSSPAVAEKLSTFSGDYSEWIAEVVRLTAFGEEMVEERMRPVMVGRMSATRWLLDLIALPEVALRHRVIKIEDEQLLSLLGLSKRAGLTYSLDEIAVKREELEKISSRTEQFVAKNQEHLLSQLDRRAGALMQTVQGIETLHLVFQERDSDNMFHSLLNAWTVLQRLEGRPAVMAVPTGNDDEQRSWETMMASYPLLELSRQLEAHKIDNSEMFAASLGTDVSAQMLLASLDANLQLLDSMIKGSEKEKPGTGEGNAANKRFGGRTTQEIAAIAAANIDSEDTFLLSTLNLIAAAPPGFSAKSIVESLSADQIASIAAPKIAAEAISVLQSDPGNGRNEVRLQEIRMRLAGSKNKDMASLSPGIASDLVRIIYDNVAERAGHLLPGGKNADTFQSNAGQMAGILAAWKSDDVSLFNASVAKYEQSLAAAPLPHMDVQKLHVEAWYNAYDPFYKAISLYMPVIVLSFIGWMVWQPMIRRTSLLLMLIAFVLHTLALGMRIWISGRAPVTNLYSSAIFIGWAMVGASFVIELLVKHGVGCLLGAVVGTATLTIARILAREEGDTLGVLVAVLDTSFWLWTHVVCITLGYAATFLAGGIGLVYCILASLRRRNSAVQLSEIGQLVYGVLCFAVVFSLVGTVLGGLWADDSWGRFWGWDPKENGAMMIVIWNALILHARWDKLVRDYGTAVLAMVGNIVTAWSWFGVNELKAGLHNYGFTDGRLQALAIFLGCQFAIIIAALVLRRRNSTLASGSSV